MAIQEKKRSEIEDIYKWDLTPIYKNEEEFLKEYEEMNSKEKKVNETNILLRNTNISFISINA